MAIPLILRLDVTGQPVKWIPWQEAACIYSKGMVAWTAGEHSFPLHGGVSRLTGLQSVVEINSIIAVKGEYKRHHCRTVPPLTNRELFRRDHQLCLYCGREFREVELTRDHVIPISRGGRDLWSNVVTACKRCNAHKGGATPEEAHMPLLAVPYVPNIAEYLVLRNRRILADQMSFLKSQFKAMEYHLLS
ncbi:MAG: HNH endonuclease [Gammaproteobacteria bacterium]|nr:HNH endonuclease [Gammaproteobacteria bacterium]MDH5652834.1 HNH endonuclease [Gammaproteobacteria bacterium]